MQTRGTDGAGGGGSGAINGNWDFGVISKDITDMLTDCGTYIEKANKALDAIFNEYTNMSNNWQGKGYDAFKSMVDTKKDTISLDSLTEFQAALTAAETAANNLFSKISGE